MLWVKALHVIFMVTWFSGLFYLPRLFVYHALAIDHISIERFKIMEKKLYWYIMTPSALLTIFMGIGLISFDPHTYLHMVWMHIKLTVVMFLIIYHIYLGLLLRRFMTNRNQHSPVFYRLLNEIPALLLILIVILAIVKPFGMISHFS